MNTTTGCDCRFCQASARIFELDEIMTSAKDNGQPVPQAVLDEMQKKADFLCGVVKQSIKLEEWSASII